MEKQQQRNIIEGALLAFGQPLSAEKLRELFIQDDDEQEIEYPVPSLEEVLTILEEIQKDFEGRGFELKHVASGWRFQVCPDLAPWVNKLWEEKPPRYSRALLETLAIIAYRQPITRGDIEEIRGVAVSSHIIKTLSEREWVKVVGQRDVPGRPSLYATTRQFLDYFNLNSLESLPSLRELTDIDALSPELDLGTEAPEAPSSDAQEGEGVSEEASAEQTEQESVAAENDELNGLDDVEGIDDESEPQPAEALPERHDFTAEDDNSSVFDEAESAVDTVTDESQEDIEAEGEQEAQYEEEQDEPEVPALENDPLAEDQSLVSDEEDDSDRETASQYDH